MEQYEEYLYVHLPELEALQTSHVTGWFNTFLHVYTSLSNPFLPCSMDSSLRLYDTSVGLN